MKNNPISNLDFSDSHISIKKVELSHKILQTVINQSIWTVIVVGLAGISGIVAFVFQTGFFADPISKNFARMQSMLLFLFIASVMMGVLYFVTLAAYRMSIHITESLGKNHDKK